MLHFNALEKKTPEKLWPNLKADCVNSTQRGFLIQDFFVNCIKRNVRHFSCSFFWFVSHTRGKLKPSDTITVNSLNNFKLLPRFHVVLQLNFRYSLAISLIGFNVASLWHKHGFKLLSAPLAAAVNEVVNNIKLG